MKQTPEGQPSQPATARAEELLGNLGRRIDLFAAQAGQRIQQTATALREEADRMDLPSTQEGEQTHSPGLARAEMQGKIAVDRAEEKVDRLGQRLGHFFGLAGFQIQRTTARLREDGEDIWVEAQHIRRRSRRPFL